MIMWAEKIFFLFFFFIFPYDLSPDQRLDEKKKKKSVYSPQQQQQQQPQQTSPLKNQSRNKEPP